MWQGFGMRVFLNWWRSPDRDGHKDLFRDLMTGPMLIAIIAVVMVALYWIFRWMGVGA